METCKTGADSVVEKEIDAMEINDDYGRVYGRCRNSKKRYQTSCKRLSRRKRAINIR